MQRVYGRLGFELEVVELEAGESVRRDTLEIGAVNVRHRVLAFGYVLAEDARPGASTPSSRSRSGSRRARTSAACSAARPSTASRPSR